MLNAIRQKEDCFFLFEGIENKNQLEILSKKFKKVVKECLSRILGNTQLKKFQKMKWDKKTNYLEKYIKIKISHQNYISIKLET